MPATKTDILADGVTAEEYARVIAQRNALATVCKKLARHYRGPTKARVGEWVGKMMEYADEAREALAAIRKAEGE